MVRVKGCKCGKADVRSTGGGDGAGGEGKG